METITINIPINKDTEAVEIEKLEVLKHFVWMLEQGVDQEFKVHGSIQSTEGSEKGNDVTFNHDAILSALPFIKQSGYFIWLYVDYKSQYKYWVTTREVRPHSWYRNVTNKF